MQSKMVCGEVWFTQEGCCTAIVATKEWMFGWTARLRNAEDGSLVWSDVKGYSLKSAEDAAQNLIVSLG